LSQSHSTGQSLTDTKTVNSHMLGQNKCPESAHLYSLTKISGQLQNSGQFQDNFEISGNSGLLGPLHFSSDWGTGM